MERENQRVAITKRLLKEGLLRLLREKELDKITVTELCKEAEINRATFYRHYEIPRDVLIDLEKDMYHELRRTVLLPASVEEVKTCLEKLCAYLEEHIDLIRLIIRCNSDTDFAMFINEIYLELWHEFEPLGMFKDMDAEDLKLLTLYSAGGSYFILRHWLLGNIHKSAEWMASYVYDLMKKTDWVALAAQWDRISE